MTILYRPAREADVNEIATVYVETWRNTYAGSLPDKVLLTMSIGRQAASWAKSIRQGREIVQVAEDSEAGIVAVGSCGANRSRRANYKGEIYTLYVASDYQNQGIGEGLLASMFEALHAVGHDSAMVWVLSDNPARFFYETVGGRRAGDRDEKIWGVTLQEIAYGWDDLGAVCTADGRLARQAWVGGED